MKQYALVCLVIFYINNVFEMLFKSKYSHFKNVSRETIYIFISYQCLNIDTDKIALYVVINRIIVK